jgi:serine/threonine-protein kinase
LATGVPCVCPDCLAEVGSAPAAEVASCPSCGFVRPAEGWQVDPLTGLILAGRYRLEGRLGAGGMASVFRASRVGALGGKVAVKVLAPRLSRTVVARRFEREAQVVSHLSNPHIVRIYDFDTFTFPGSSQPLYFIAMELVDGRSLSQLLRKQGEVNFMWAIDVLRQCARGLDEAHANGIVHRDLKPANIMLMQQREATHVKLVDFGIAGIAEIEGEPVEKLTQTGFVSGTPDYMAPEQCIGSQPVGPPADIYSLGVVAFELFTGQRPFSGDSMMDVLMQRVTRPAPSLRESLPGHELPPDIYRIVDKMLARKPEDRYPNAGELLEDLARFPSLMTRPDLPVTLAEIAEFGTLTAQRAATVGIDAQVAPTAVAQPVTAPRAQISTEPTATASVVLATPPPPATEDTAATEATHRPRWPWFALGGAVIGGGAVAAALLMGGPGGGEIPPPDPVTTVASAADADVSSAAGADVSISGVAADASSLAPTADTARAPDTVVTVTRDAADAAAHGGADTLAPQAPQLTLDGPRPPLEAGFLSHAVAAGEDVVTLAVADPLPPLFRGVPLRLAVDRRGAPLRLVSATVVVTLESTGAAVGHADGRGRPDGRVALDLPALPIASTYRLALEATLADGTSARWTVRYDADKGTPGRLP